MVTQISYMHYSYSCNISHLGIFGIKWSIGKYGYRGVYSSKKLIFWV